MANLDFAQKKKDLEAKSAELNKQREKLIQQADEIAMELMRIQGEYRLIGELLDKTPTVEEETEKEKGK